jgi:hypothetical protein
MAADLSVPRMDDWFWDVSDSAEHSLRSLCGQLEALPRDKLYAFVYQYQDAMEQLPTCDQHVPRRTAAVRVPDDFDEEDFADWVVSQGRAFYYDLRRQPEWLQACVDMYRASEEGRGFLELRWDETLDRDEYRGSQSPFQVGFAIYRARVGENIQHLIAGYDWDPDLAEREGLNTREGG